MDDETAGQDFGRVLKARREELGLTRRELVDASGLSYPYVSQLETGSRLPSHRSLARLARALQLEPTELGGRDHVRRGVDAATAARPDAAVAGRRDAPAGWCRVVRVADESSLPPFIGRGQQCEQTAARPGRRRRPTGRPDLIAAPRRSPRCAGTRPAPGRGRARRGAGPAGDFGPPQELSRVKGAFTARGSRARRVEYVGMAVAGDGHVGH